jgi:hypothetical protein
VPDPVPTVRQRRRLLAEQPVKRRGRAQGRGYGGAGLARYSGENECPRCGRDIEDWSDAAKTSKGAWVHKSCMAGADD